MSQNEKLPTNTFPWVPVLGFLGVVVAAYIGFLNNQAQIKIPIEYTQTYEAKLSTLTMQVILQSTNTPQPTFIPVITFTSTPYICPYQRPTDDETIVALIQAESVAALKKDMTIIQDIFDPDANFQDYAGTPPNAVTPAKEWHGALARYQELFNNVDFRDAMHFGISPAGRGILGNVATYTSGSQITYRVNGGDFIEQTNGSSETTKYGSEHWMLKKNNNGCWVITQMEFNAGHIIFP